jgi:hypothetical protein
MGSHNTSCLENIVFWFHDGFVVFLQVSRQVLAWDLILGHGSFHNRSSLPLTRLPTLYNLGNEKRVITLTLINTSKTDRRLVGMVGLLVVHCAQ